MKQALSLGLAYVVSMGRDENAEPAPSLCLRGAHQHREYESSDITIGAPAFLAVIRQARSRVRDARTLCVLHQEDQHTVRWTNQLDAHEAALTIAEGFVEDLGDDAVLTIRPGATHKAPEKVVREIKRVERLIAILTNWVTTRNPRQVPEEDREDFDDNLARLRAAVVAPPCREG